MKFFKTVCQLMPLLFSIVGSACSPAENPESDLAVGGRQIGNFRGLSVIQTMINDRIYDGHQGIEVGNILGRPLNSLLGAFTEGSTSSVFESAAPHAVNVLLWEILMKETASNIAIETSFGSYGKMNDDIRNLLFELNSANNIADDHESLRSLWQMVMRYEAPESEREAWVTAVTEPEHGLIAQAESDERSSQLLQSLFMHPYFLIEH